MCYDINVNYYNVYRFKFSSRCLLECWKGRNVFIGEIDEAMLNIANYNTHK